MLMSELNSLVLFDDLNTRLDFLWYLVPYGVKTGEASKANKLLLPCWEGVNSRTWTSREGFDQNRKLKRLVEAACEAEPALECWEWALRGQSEPHPLRQKHAEALRKGRLNMLQKRSLLLDPPGLHFWHIDLLQ